MNFDSDLENFLESKVENDYPNLQTVFNLYCKLITNTIIKVFNNFKTIDYSLTALEMIHNIFWIVLNYSNNMKLTMFLSERSIILFSEYINLSENIHEDVNFVEIKNFIYKKSLGGIVYKDNNFYYELYKLTNIYKKLIYNCINLNNNTTILNLINSKYAYIFYYMFINKQLYFLNNISLNLTDFKNINRFFFKVNIYYYILMNIKNIDIIDTIYNTLVKNTISFKTLCIDIDETKEYKTILNMFNALNI